MLAVARVVDDVEVERGRFVRQIDQCGAARVRRRRVEQVDECDRSQHPTTAARARGNRRGFEPPGEQEQAIGLAPVERDLVPVLIHDHEPGGHASTVAPGPALPCSPLVSWLVRAITIVDGHLEVADRPVPEPGPDEAVVRVHGAGLNRADLLQRAGRYPAPPGWPADVPGMEFAGEIAAVGANVTTRSVGDRVFGLTGGGAQAEYVAVPAVHCAIVPPNLDLGAMGGVPETFITVHDAVVTQARLTPGEWLLVHAVGSGIGTTALQLAKAMGAQVVGTARSSDKLERCRALGLDAGLEPTRTADGALDVDALAWAIVEATGGGADVTLDTVGGDYVVADVNAAASKGRIVCIGTIAGGRVTLPIMSILGKRLTIIGTVLRGRDVAEKAEATDAFVRDVVPLLADGRLAPIIEATLPLDRAEEAYNLLESDATFGKVILDCR
jgi:putative PIG3 family NAD(P)H quinone oxidoreductase